jgi:hypothetical protein
MGFGRRYWESTDGVNRPVQARSVIIRVNVDMQEVKNPFEYLTVVGRQGAYAKCYG